MATIAYTTRFYRSTLLITYKSQNNNCRNLNSDLVIACYVIGIACDVIDFVCVLALARELSRDVIELSDFSAVDWTVCGVTSCTVVYRRGVTYCVISA